MQTFFLCCDKWTKMTSDCLSLKLTSKVWQGINLIRQKKAMHSFYRIDTLAVTYDDNFFSLNKCFLFT